MQLDIHPCHVTLLMPEAAGFCLCPLERELLFHDDHMVLLESQPIKCPSLKKRPSYRRGNQISAVKCTSGTKLQLSTAAATFPLPKCAAISVVNVQWPLVTSQHMLLNPNSSMLSTGCIFASQCFVIPVIAYFLNLSSLGQAVPIANVWAQAGLDLVSGSSPE